MYYYMASAASSLESNTGIASTPFTMGKYISTPQDYPISFGLSSS
jgi:hypothetical protein